MVNGGLLGGNRAPREQEAHIHDSETRDAHWRHCEKMLIAGAEVG